MLEFHVQSDPIYECGILKMLIQRMIIRSWGERGSWSIGELIAEASTHEVHRRA
jgi:hypothetical protein